MKKIAFVLATLIICFSPLSYTHAAELNETELRLLSEIRDRNAIYGIISQTDLVIVENFLRREDFTISETQVNNLLVDMNRLTALAENRLSQYNAANVSNLPLHVKEELMFIMAESAKIVGINALFNPITKEISFVMQSTGETIFAVDTTNGMYLPARDVIKQTGVQALIWTHILPLFLTLTVFMAGKKINKAYG